MKNHINFFYFLLLPCFIYGQKIDTITLQSRFFNSKRQIYVYLPENYNNNPKQYFEVIYVFDAQIFEYSRLVYFTQPFLNHSLFSTLIVGISSEEDRNKDFLPTKEFPPESFSEKHGHFGDAEKLLNFVIEEVDSVITTKYRSLPKRIAIGHSLGATFISYCFLQRPDFFDGYIAISPNFSYDKYQFVHRFKNIDENKIRSEKFFYMCNSNEALDFSESWKTGRDSITAILKGKNFENKIKFINEDFSTTEDHTSVYPLGVRNGLKSFFDYYHNADNLMAFYGKMYMENKFDLTPENTNYMAYNFLWSHKTKDALKLILWAHKLFPNDLNIIDGMGEISLENGDTQNAKRYFNEFEKRLEEQKTQLSAEKYEELKSNHEERVNAMQNK